MDRSWSAWQRNRVEWAYWVEGVAFWSGGAPSSDIQLSGEAFFVLAWNLAIVKIAQSLSVCIVLHIQFIWLHDWHIWLIWSLICYYRWTAPPSFSGNHVYWDQASAVWALTPDPQQINQPNINSQLKRLCSKYYHDIFMHELSICHDTEDTHTESKNEPSGSFMAPGFIRQGRDGGGEGESVSFNRHLGFDCSWGATWGVVSFYSWGYRGEELSYIQDLSCDSGRLGCPVRNVSHTDDAFLLLYGTEQESGRWM